MADAKSFFQRAGIPTPTLTVEGLYASVVALKESVDVLVNQRAGPLEMAVLRRDLILTGIMTNPEYPFTIPPRDNYAPGLGFGDPPLATGIAHQVSTPIGRWFRIGSLVFFTVVINLANKGTATGHASFSLPYMSRPTPNGYFFCPCFLHNVAGTIGPPLAVIAPGSDHAFLWHLSGGAQTPITDASLTDVTQVGCSGWYEAYVETTPGEVSLQRSPQ